MPVLYAETRESGSDEVAGLQRKKQASIPIYRKFSRVKSYADAFFMPFYLHICKIQKEGCELSAKIGQLKMQSSDGKKYLTEP